MDKNSLETKRRKRTGAPKVKTGCITCRIRRVKCDEEKPNCKRCTSTGRKCDGYKVLHEAAAAIVNVSEARDSNPLDHHGLLSDLNGTKDDLRSFDFFRNRTAPILSGYFDSEFWNCLLLRFCHSDLTIRHAIMAVSSIHEQFEKAKCHGIGECPGRAGNRFALYHYNLAIRSLNSRLTSSRLPMENLLMTCVLFICLEFLRGDQDMAIAHLQSGARILCSYREQRRQLLGEISYASSDCHLIEDVLLPIFARLNVLSSLFGRIAPDLLPIFTISISEDAISTPMSFPSVLKARNSLIGIGNAVVHYDLTSADCLLGRAVDDCWFEKREAINKQLQKWSGAFGELMNTSLANMSSKDIRGTCLLMLQHKGLSLMLASSRIKEQIIPEIYNDDFETIISLSQFILHDNQHSGICELPHFEFSFEMVIVPQLYLTAVKCHSPEIRRKARDILSSSPRWEGLWHSVEAAEAAETIMVIEGKEEALLSEANLRNGFKNGETLEEMRLFSYPNPFSAAYASKLRHMSNESIQEPQGSIKG